jgi:hypothetical protein
VSAKTDNSITVEGKTYTLDRGAKVMKDGNTTALAKRQRRRQGLHRNEKQRRPRRRPISGWYQRVVVLNKDEAAGVDRGDRSYARDKTSDSQREAHERICQGHHGTVTAKTDNSVTIEGKTYAMSADTRVIKGSDAAVTLKKVTVGDTVCFDTQAAADGSQQVTALMTINKDEKVRVREKDSDSPGKGEVETPNKKDEAK